MANGPGSSALDMLDAFVVFGFRGVSPVRILQSIASGLLGAGAYRGGFPAAALGLGLHFLIALTAAAVYFAASRKLALLVKRPVPCGIAFGIGVYFFMQFLVLPLSRFPGASVQPLPLVINGLFIHACGIGLPIALFASRSAQGR